MGKVKCPYCGGGVKKLGKAGAGSQRWRCLECDATSARKIDNSAKLLSAFLGWLLGGKAQGQLSMPAGTFRRKCARSWSAWPLAPKTGEAHRAVSADGTRLARNVAILVAPAGRHVIGWHTARSESSRSWAALMPPIPPPDVAVADGGPGLGKARRKIRPDAKAQRCAFRAFNQARKQATAGPDLQAGVELYGPAKELPHVETAEAAAAWLQASDGWRARREGLLAERTLDEEAGKWGWTHERPATARSGLNTLIERGALFTSLDPDLVADGPVARTNNRLEGGVSAQLGEMLRRRRGSGTLRRAKAVYWRCYMHSECPMGAAEILYTMPAGDDIAGLCRSLAYEPQKRDGPQERGDGPVWSELHHSSEWRLDRD